MSSKTQTKAHIHHIFTHTNQYHKYTQRIVYFYVFVLTILLHSLPGFCRLRMHSKGSPHLGSVPVAFVEFKNAACAGSAMAQLQGRYLLSSDRGSIRIEFAKAKMTGDVAAALALNASYPGAAAAVLHPNHHQLHHQLHQHHHHHLLQHHQLQQHYIWKEVCVLIVCMCVNAISIYYDIMIFFYFHDCLSLIYLYAVSNLLL